VWAISFFPLLAGELAGERIEGPIPLFKKANDFLGVGKTHPYINSTNDVVRIA